MSSSTARPSAIGATSPATRARAPTSRRITAPVASTPAPSRVPSRSLSRRVPTSASASASASEAATSALGIEYPASAPGEGALGRGLFSTGADPSVPLIRTPLDVTLCVPEAVDPGASPECAAAVRALYARWSDSLGVAPPDAVVDFLVAAEFPKDLRVAVALMWATRNVPQWRAYKDDVIPREYESLYLATDEELDALQDENVRRMAVGSRMNYAAGWSAVGQSHPEIVAALDEGAVADGPATQEEFDWARATAHTRAMSGALGGAPCAFIVPGVDLANHSFRPNTIFGVAEDGESFQLTWDTEHSTAPGKSREPEPPRANDEVLICYGARMPNALLMLHYGFLDPENPNDQLPMECMIPGARKIRSSAVSAAGKALSDEGDERAEWAARCMLAMADPTGAGDDGSDAACVAEMDAAAEAILDGFPTTEEEDRALVEAGDMSPRMEMCVRYRMLQKQNVTAFRRFLEAVTREAKKA